MKYFKDNKLDVPRSIVFDELDNGKTIKMTINAPYANMQCNNAAFEGWALLMRCRLNYEKVIISFVPIEWNKGFVNLTNKQTHYMRFLFRLCRFNEYMDWVEIDDSVKDIICGFADKLKKVTTKANYPGKDSSVSEDKDRVEHQTEKLLVKDRGNYLNEVIKKSRCDFEIKPPHDQLPNGLFMDEVAERTRIFPTGFFDIWAIDTAGEKLCIFELKISSNTAVGIISELFFYAEYAKFVFLDKNKTAEDEKRFHAVHEEYRGYKELQKALTNNEINGIQAVFLVEKLHSRLAENIGSIICELNKSEKVRYSVVYYNRNQIPK